MIGALIGISGGVLQYFILKYLVNEIRSGARLGRLLVLFFAQIPLPAGCLLGCALFLEEQLLYAGLGFAVSLSVIAIGVFSKNLTSKGREKGD